MTALICLVLGLVVIAAATVVGERSNIASPLLLVGLGIIVSFLPFVPAIEIEPEWILAGVLPPLLYSAAVSLPAMNLRREFGAISGLSVLLVAISTVLLGLFFAWAVPGLGLTWGFALGAIVSPTDAVATKIVKRCGVSPRVTTILEGEGLLNDATALVALRAAIAAAAGAINVWGTLGRFGYAVVVAVVIGYAAGRLNLLARARVPATVNTVLSFTVPFWASIPAELLGASGLVAAVAAGLVTGRRAPRELPPWHRLSDTANWRTVELILEGAIFLLMGLELFGILQEVNEDHLGVGTAVVVASLALLITVLVRAAYVAPLLAWLDQKVRRGARIRDRIEGMHNQLTDPEAETPVRRGGPGQGREASPEDLERFATRVRRLLADIDYLLAAPLGWREGAVVVWAGMRGAVTVAAAQTLPADTPRRPLLVLVAFLVAAGSLLVQGGTLAWLIGRLHPAGPDPEAEKAERLEVLAMLHDVGPTVERPADTSQESWTAYREARIHQLRLQRDALLDARDDGAFSAEVLEGALANLDADELSLQLKGPTVE